MRGTAAIYRRDIKKFLSNPFVIIMTLFMPIMYLVVFGNAMGGAITGVPVGIVQEEPYLDPTPLFQSSSEALSRLAQPGEAPTFAVRFFSSETSAKGALAAGGLVAVVVFPSEVSNTHAVRLYLDSSDFAVPALVESGVRGVLQQQGFGGGLEVNRVYGEIDYFQFFGVGVIVMAIFMSTMMGGVLSLIRDWELGTIEGYLVTRVKRSSIVLGIVGSGTTKGFLAGTVIFVVVLAITGVPFPDAGTTLLVLLVLAMISAGLTSLVFFIASRLRNQQSFAAVNGFLNLMLFMTSGAFYPVLGMPGWLRALTVVNPEYYAVHALRSLILRGQGLGAIAVDLLALGLFAGLCILLGISTFRRTLE
ncbi:MAG: ABC transporter permease [Methanospirillum sp.]|nr:ABC transporter permease [Methanospirillum sp.]